MREPVKGRTEAGRRREARARQTRERIVAAAVDLFVRDGYAVTTVEAIATHAGVAPATVYQAFGRKLAVLAAAVDAEIAGDVEPVAVLDRDWVTAMRTEGDVGVRLAVLVEHTATIAARTLPIKEVVRDAAATEPEARELLEEDSRRRYRTQRQLLALAIGDHPLREGLTLDEATVAYFTFVNSDTYRLVVRERGWSERRWRRWLLGVVQRELIGN